MLTENILKSKLVTLTGRVRFRTTERNDRRGIHEFTYVLSFETVVNDEKEFYDLYTKLSNLKEFANLNSIEKYLDKINFLSDGFLLKGEITSEEANAQQQRT